MIYLSIILATLCIQVPNIWAIKAFDKSPTIPTAMFVALMCLPASFLATASYAFFYGKGYQFFSYPASAVLAYGTSMLMSIVIQILFLGGRHYSAMEVIGSLMILTGMSVVIYFKTPA